MKNNKLRLAVMVIVVGLAVVSGWWIQRGLTIADTDEMAANKTSTDEPGSASSWGEQVNAQPEPMVLTPTADSQPPQTLASASATPYNEIGAMHPGPVDDRLLARGQDEGLESYGASDAQIHFAARKPSVLHWPTIKASTSRVHGSEGSGRRRELFRHRNRVRHTRGCTAINTMTNMPVGLHRCLRSHRRYPTRRSPPRQQVGTINAASRRVASHQQVRHVAKRTATPVRSPQSVL